MVRQYVALYEGGGVSIYLTKREGELVLAGHIDATGSASFEDPDAERIRKDASVRLHRG